MRRCLPAILVSLLTSISLPAFAAYKCESNGKVTYSDTPCLGGKQSELAGNAAVSEQEAAHARQEAKREKAELKQLEKDRHKQEAVEEKQAKFAARDAARKNNKCALLAQRVKWSEEDASHAAGKFAEKAKRKARRTAESYELQCK